MTCSLAMSQPYKIRVASSDAHCLPSTAGQLVRAPHWQLPVIMTRNGKDALVVFFQIIGEKAKQKNMGWWSAMVSRHKSLRRKLVAII